MGYPYLVVYRRTGRGAHRVGMPVAASPPRSAPGPVARSGVHSAAAPVALGLAVAAGAWAVGRVQPLLSPLLVALVAGAVLANLPVRRRLDGAASVWSTLLRCGIALVGLRLSVQDVTALGVFGPVLVLTTVLSTFAATRYAGRRCSLDPELTLLLAAGFSICGAAAVAAVQDGIRAAQAKVALALALVTVHGTVLLVAIPTAARLLGLSRTQAAVWAGASIHEVAQVAAAATVIGGGSAALAVAMSVKLGRVLLLAPVHRAVAAAVRRGSATPLRGAPVPWFLWAFVAAVALRATGIVPAGVLQPAAALSSILLAAGMFGLGLGIVVKQLWPLPAPALAVSAVATTTVTVVPLLLLLARGSALA